jgi:hypothetical protein
LVLVAVGAQVLMVRALVRTLVLVRALVLVLRAPLVRALVAGALVVR